MTPTTITIDRILKEKLISFAQAAQKLPPSSSGVSVTPSCLWRWATSGLRATDGRVVRLESVRLGRRLLTSEDAIRRFIAAQQPVADAIDGQVAETPRPQTPTQPRRNDAAVAELRKRQGRG